MTRTLSTLAALSAMALTGCSEQSFFIPNEVNDVVEDGSIVGRVCDPTGRTWLADAMAYTHLYNDAGEPYDTRIAYSDRDGYFTFEELPAEREYVVWVQYGNEVLDTYEEWLGEGDELRLDQPDCFDPLQLDVAVITGDYDEFQDVLQNMGFENFELIDGLDEDELHDFLMDGDGLQQYDMVFFNGGFIEEEILYCTEDADDNDIADCEEVEDTEPDYPTILANIKEYVEGGGAIYASDWAYDVVEQTWPDRIDFVGDDTVPDAAQLGEYDVINAAINDAAMAEWLATDYVDVEFDLPVWPPVESVSDGVSVHLTGSVAYSIGTSTYDLAGVPLLMSFTAGEGKVAFSTFRVAKNASTDMVMVLQYMMYNL